MNGRSAVGIRAVSATAPDRLGRADRRRCRAATCMQGTVWADAPPCDRAGAAVRDVLTMAAALLVISRRQRTDRASFVDRRKGPIHAGDVPSRWRRARMRWPGLLRERGASLLYVDPELDALAGVRARDGRRSASSMTTPAEPSIHLMRLSFPPGRPTDDALRCVRQEHAPAHPRGGDGRRHRPHRRRGRAARGLRRAPCASARTSSASRSDPSSAACRSAARLIAAGAGTAVRRGARGRAAGRAAGLRPGRHAGDDLQRRPRGAAPRLSGRDAPAALDRDPGCAGDGRAVDRPRRRRPARAPLRAQAGRAELRPLRAQALASARSGSNASRRAGSCSGRGSSARPARRRSVRWRPTRRRRIR